MIREWVALLHIVLAFKLEYDLKIIKKQYRNAMSSNATLFMAIYLKTFEYICHHQV